MASIFFSLTGGGSSREAPPHQPAPRERPATLYFAYGSNMNVAQMAQRCPQSIFKGRATLASYRWQINQRGVANVVESADDSVEGLLYLVGPRDERALDRAEGISRSFYQRHRLPVSYKPDERFQDFKSARVAAALAHQGPGPGETGRAGSSPTRQGSRHGDPQRGEDGWQLVEALVYISEGYKEDGAIRDEYIGRMRKAVADAVALGVSQSFVDRTMMPHLIEKVQEQLPASGAVCGGQQGRHHDQSRSSPSQEATAGAASTGRNQTTRPPKTSPGEFGSTGGPRRSEVSRDTSLPLGVVDLQALRRANRKVHIDSGLRFPDQMMARVTEASNEEAIRREANPAGPTIYLVVVGEPTDGSGPPFIRKIEVATHDLSLANELAMKHLLEAWSRCYADRAANGMDEGAAKRDGNVEWELRNGACLHLGFSMAGSTRPTYVWVEEQAIFAAYKTNGQG